MRKNAKLSDVLFYALQCAIRDREALADCYDWKGKDAEEALEAANRFKELSVLICGTSKSEFDRIIENAQTITLEDLRKQHE